tara:strand:- start:72 stop:572 length:501 start_codon:yes stop_codon:yes gene_type:complete
VYQQNGTRVRLALQQKHQEKNRQMLTAYEYKRTANLVQIATSLVNTFMVTIVIIFLRVLGAHSVEHIIATDVQHTLSKVVKLLDHALKMEVGIAKKINDTHYIVIFYFWIIILTNLMVGHWMHAVVVLSVRSADQGLNVVPVQELVLFVVAYIHQVNQLKGVNLKN